MIGWWKGLGRMADVFVSYSRRDGDFVRRLATDLEARVTRQLTPAERREYGA
jgi:hypothetical protein